MSSLREIKTRIASVKSTLKTTSAMKMVASAKLHKAQAAIGNKLPYEQKLRNILSGALQSEDLRKALAKELGHRDHSPVVLQDVSADALPSKPAVKRLAVVVFSSNSSMCGGFNAAVIKKCQETLESLHNQGYTDDDTDIYTVGKKAADSIRKQGYTIKKDCSDMADKPSYEKSSDLANILINDFIQGRIEQVILLYNHFASPSSQPSVRETYLPLPLNDFASRPANDKTEPVDYTLEPDPLALVNELLPKVLLLKMYTVLLDANAAEHAARTLAMQIATDNAQDLIAELTLAYNKGRQTEITAEILDLVSGSMQ